jgi:hypothetical protein
MKRWTCRRSSRLAAITAQQFCSISRYQHLSARGGISKTKL